MKKYFGNWLASALILTALTVFLAGCGGSSDSTPAATTSELTGTVATGAPVAQGTAVTIKDAKGVSKTTTTLDANGLYKVSVGDLTPPFVICVDNVLPAPAIPCASGTGTSDKVLMSVANEAGTANVTPMTKLAAANAAGVTDPTSIFNTGSTLNSLTSAKIADGQKAITDLMGDFLKAAGVDPTQFNPLTTAFLANSKGVDSVLDQVKPTLGAGGAVTISFPNNANQAPVSITDITKLTQDASTIATSMKGAWSNVATLITPPTGTNPIIPSGVTLPPGFQIPANATIPAGVQIPPGVTIPAGVKFDPTVKMDPSVISNLPAGVTAPTGASVSVPIPSNAIIPQGVTFPSGTYTMPAGVKLPDGFSVPSGVTLASGIKLPSNVDLSGMTTTMPSGITIPSGAMVPATWQTSPPAGVTIPTGAQFGPLATTGSGSSTPGTSAPATSTPGTSTPSGTTPTVTITAASCDAGYTGVTATTGMPAIPNLATACSTMTFCANNQGGGGYFVVKGNKVSFNPAQLQSPTEIATITASITSYCK